MLHRLLAVEPTGGLGKLKQTLTNVGTKGYGAANSQPLPVIVGKVIQQFLALLGVLFLALTIYAGYRWMMARGNETEVTKARETLKMAVIGLAIMLSAYAISSFVVTKLAEQTLGTI